MFALESPHRGDSDEAILISTYTIPFSITKTKICLTYPKSAAMDFFQGTQERVRNSRGKRATSVRATEGLLYSILQFSYRTSIIHSTIVASTESKSMYKLATVPVLSGAPVLAYNW